MIYYHHEMRDNTPVNIDALLHKYFPENTWGVCANVDIKHNYQNYEICKLTHEGKSTTWTHYAHIMLYDTGEWEVNSQFKGEGGNEMWIYGYYKNFANACKRVHMGIEELKPVIVY